MAWKNILNFDVIQNFVKRITGVTINAELKEKGFNELQKKYTDDEIYEKEATEIEQELIKIYIELLEEKGQIKKRIRIPLRSRGMRGISPGMVDPEYIRKFLQEYPELRKLLEELLDDDEDEDDDYGSDDDRISDMYI